MLYRLVGERAKASPDKIAIIGEKRSLTYGQFFQEVRKCASFLRDLQIKAEEPIVIGLPPSPESYVLFYGAWANGATVIPVLSSGKIPSHILKVKPVVAVGDRGWVDAAERSWPDLRASILWDKERGLSLPAPARPFSKKRLFRQEQVVALSSSGSTGQPTLYLRSAERLLSHAELMAKVLGIQPQDVLITTRQFSNAASINIHVLLPIVAGCKVVVMEKFNRFETARAIAREKVTVIQAVPFVYEMLASIPATYPINFSSLRLCISGGAALARSVFDSFYKRFGIFLRQRYTGTQVSPAFTYSDCDIAGAVGHVGGFFPVAILDDEGRELGPGRIGEIAFDVSKVKDPFWKKQIKANRNRRGNYVHSGDLGKTDVAGNVFVVGRKSPFIKVGGNRVEPAEVESVLLSHPRVKEAVVFATQPGQADEGVGAVVVPRGRLKREDLLVYCGERLDSYKCPRKIELRKNLPRNAQGKVIRYLFDRSAAGSLPQDE